MTENDNGFTITSISYENNQNFLTEGAIVGISFAWIVGLIGLYILGMCLIRIYYKNSNYSSESSVANHANHRK